MILAPGAAEGVKIQRGNSDRGRPSKPAPRISTGVPKSLMEPLVIEATTVTRITTSRIFQVRGTPGRLVWATDRGQPVSGASKEGQ